MAAEQSRQLFYKIAMLGACVLSTLLVTGGIAIGILATLHKNGERAQEEIMMDFLGFEMTAKGSFAVLVGSGVFVFVISVFLPYLLLRAQLKLEKRPVKSRRPKRRGKN